MVKYSAITTCKGRLGHLRETLPMLSKLPDTEVILVDYGCPEQSGKWAASNCPDVTVVEVLDDAGFNLPRARNRGAECSKADFLLFIDADVKISPNALETVDGLIDPNSFVTIDPKDSGDDIRGTFFVPRKAFVAVGGYDELLKNYGMEDMELYTRLRDAGLSEKRTYLKEIDVIRHGDDLRIKHFDSKSVLKLKLTAIVYQQYIKPLRRMLGLTQLPMSTRAELHSACVNLVDQFTNVKDPSGGIRLDMKVPHEIKKGELGDVMDWEFQLSMTVKPRNPAAFRKKCEQDRENST